MLQGLRLSGAAAGQRTTSDQGVTCDLLCSDPGSPVACTLDGADDRCVAPFVELTGDSGASEQPITAHWQGRCVAVDVRPSTHDCACSPVRISTASHATPAQVRCDSVLRTVMCFERRASSGMHPEPRGLLAASWAWIVPSRFLCAVHAG